MKERIGDAFFWVFSLNGLICSVIWIIIGIMTGDILFSFYEILIFIFFIVAGWLLRYLLTGRSDISLSLTNTAKPHI
jgi:hypothetical protein